MQTDPNNLMTRYLLGELPEAEMSAFEARYFAEPALFNELLAAESMLVDDYSRNRLSSDLRERFESGYLTNAARRERVSFGEALVSRLDAVERTAVVPSQTSPWAWFTGYRPALTFSFAAAAVLLVIGGIWLMVADRPSDEVVQIPPTNSEIGVTEPPKDQPQNVAANDTPPAADPDEANTNTRPKATPTPETRPVRRSVTLALTIGSVRGGDPGQTAVLNLSPETTDARLVVDMQQNEYTSYRLTLQTISGRNITSRIITKPKGTSVFLKIPTEKLSPGDHVLTVSGIESDGSTVPFGRSLFRVKK